MTPTPAPEPTANAGDVLTAEQVEQLKKSGEIIAGYPVGDQLIAVKWGVATPENVRQAMNENVNAEVGPEHGRPLLRVKTTDPLVTEHPTR